jgi:ABC-type polysaccharide/polyol phosphate export permease
MVVASLTSGERWDLIRREYDYWWRQYRRRWRGTVVINVANPVLFLIAIGAGIGRLVTPTADTPAAAALGGVTYLAFFAPGMLAAASMQNGIIEGLQVVRGRMPDGPYQPAITSPLEPSDILFGHVLYMAVRIAMSAAAFLVVMVALGAAHSWLVVLTLPAATLTGLAFATPTAAWGATVDDPGRVGDLFKWVVMPMYLFSGTFFATEQLPGWAQLFVKVTPLWHGVELCRTLSLGTATWPGSGVHIGYLGVVTVVGLMLARRTFAKNLHR